MPRVLPWKRREAAAQAQASSSLTAQSSPIQRVKREETISRSSPAAASTTNKNPKRPRRTASSSPPPEPPEEKLMIDGIDGDNRYRMVEDEFLTTARQFTAHLHAAEYKRLKTASAAESAQMFKNISRPVVGQMTQLTRIKLEKKALADKQQLGTRKLLRGDSVDDSSGDDNRDGSWQSQSLHGLMESPRKRIKGVDRLPTALPVTRAAAGFHPQSSEPSSPSRPKSRPPPHTARHQIHENQDFGDSTTNHGLAHRISQPDFTSTRGSASTTRMFKKPTLSSSPTPPQIPQAHTSKATKPRAAETSS
ncbi:hypothetical protein F4808DRAFT_461115 [Astrocystis sublimbata]|nr:hypothetical protein F4808DRAFT_461115 [Astrocystis sublimbata]